MRKTLTCNKPFCHKDHRTIPLSITTKITVKEKEDLGCVYTKPGKKYCFQWDNRHIFQRYCISGEGRSPFADVCPNTWGRWLTPSWAEVLILTGCSGKGWQSGQALALNWRARQIVLSTPLCAIWQVDESGWDFLLIILAWCSISTAPGTQKL